MLKSITVAALMTVAGVAYADNNPSGTWLSGDGGTRVRIAHCGGGLCGKIVWLKQPTDPRTGKPKTDQHNPNAARKNRPMIGLQVVQNMKPSGANKWSGQIYNADDGKTYRSNLQMLSASKARVEGCVLVFCKGENWTRVR